MLKTKVGRIASGLLLESGYPFYLSWALIDRKQNETPKTGLATDNCGTKSKPYLAQSHKGHKEGKVKTGE
ncbi:MAG: hypothetical protein KAT62_08450 [Desulfuromonadales bacterium]|nr:hypothetical protein [Desulfuromonadales bacterium]